MILNRSTANVFHNASHSKLGMHPVLKIRWGNSTMSSRCLLSHTRPTRYTSIKLTLTCTCYSCRLGQQLDISEATARRAGWRVFAWEGTFTVHLGTVLLYRSSSFRPSNFANVFHFLKEYTFLLGFLWISFCLPISQFLRCDVWGWRIVVAFVRICTLMRPYASGPCWILYSVLQKYPGDYGTVIAHVLSKFNS